ncbi:MAG: DNA polymerase III subunit delta [Clostridiales bacterium 38-18]|nr:MAG: DNA polymerase III subunit delta [Clostridiales bacterium 38-18]
MDFMTYFKKIKNGDLDRITLITGDEVYLIDNLIKYIGETYLMPSYLDFNYSIYDQITDMDTVVGTANTLPFFDDKRIVLFQNSGVLKSSKDEQEDKLLDLLKNIPDHLYVIFAEVEIDKRKKTYKYLSKHSQIVNVEKLSRQELVKWISKRFKTYEKDISLHILNYLIEMINYLEESSDKNLYDVDNIIRMLSGLDSEITEEVINQYIEVPIEQNIFKMMDAISTKEITNAIQILNQLINNGEAEIKIFFLINQQFRNILKTKLLLSEGHSSSTIASKLEIHPFVAKKAGQFASQFSVKQLTEIISMLEEVDTSMKSSGTAPTLLIEKAIFDIALIK